MRQLTNFAGALVLASLACAIPAQAQVQTNVVVTVRDQDNPARQPVQFGMTVSFLDGQQFATLSAPFVVPANKRLVIEMVTGEIFVPTNQQVRVTLGTTAGGVPAQHKLLFVTKTDSTGTQDILSATVPVRFYADGGTLVRLDVIRSALSGSTGTGEITLSGYLVDM